MNRLNNLFYVTALLLCLSYACSYEDKTTYAGEPLPDIVIDTTGIPVTHVITREDTLIIKPVVSKAGLSKDQFDFEWRLTLKPGEDFSLSKVIGTEEELKYYVEDIPDASTYGLWYRVKDKTNDLMESILWKVQVDASSGQGLVVACTQDGKTTDFSIVQDSLFTYQYRDKETLQTKATSYRHHMYSKQNGKTFDGVVQWMFAQARYMDGRLTYMLHGASRHNVFRINTLDYSILLEGKENFYDPFVEINVDYYGLVGGYYAVLSNGGRIYGLQTERNTATVFNKFGLDVPGDYTSNGCISEYSNFAWFDPEKGTFFTTSGYISSYSTVSKFTNPASGAIEGFNMEDMKGYTLLAGGDTRQDHCFILEKEGRIGLYALTKSYYAPFNPRLYMDVTEAPGIERATSFAFNSSEDVVYYVADNIVRAIIYSGRQPQYKELYNPGEKVEFIRILKKTGSKFVPFVNKCLLVVTGSENSKIHALKLGTTNTAEYTEVTVFDDFQGRITAVAVQD
ncbi:MAG: hypothetical protein K2I90_03305 [Odoribacter sp.]|nr:hypothetical protein [Odoribacter sp.]